MPGKDGYPTKKELKKIKDWDPMDWNGLLEYIRGLWYYPDRFVLTGKKVKRLYLSTGGWSGNEDIIGVLAKTMFWYFFWQKSKRGGHYWFKVKVKKGNKNGK